MCECWVRHQVLVACVFCCSVCLSTLLVFHCHLLSDASADFVVPLPADLQRLRREVPPLNVSDSDIDGENGTYVTKSSLAVTSHDNVTSILVSSVDTTTTATARALVVTDTPSLPPPVLAAAAERWTHAQEGWLAATAAVAFIVGLVVWHVVFSKAGSRLAFSACLLLAACAVCVQPFVPWPWLLLVRAATGLLCGSAVPAMAAVVRVWASVRSRSQFVSCLVLSLSIAPVLTFGLSAVGHAAGASDWLPNVVLGVLCAIGCLLWLGLQRDRPQRHPFITGQEMDRLLTGKGRRVFEPAPITQVPFGQMLTSPALLVLVLSGLARGLAYGWLVYSVPVILARDCLSEKCMRPADVALYMTAAFLAQLGIGLCLTAFADRMRFGREETLKVKLFTAVAHVSCGLCLGACALLPLIGWMPQLKTRLLMASIVVLAFEQPGLWRNVAGHSRQHTPVVLTGVAGGGLGLGLLGAGVLLHSLVWHHAQLVVAALLLLSALPYMVWADGQPAKWTGAQDVFDALGRPAHQHSRDDSQSIEAGIIEMNVIPPPSQPRASE